MILSGWAYRCSTVAVIAIAACHTADAPNVAALLPVVEVGDTLPSILVKDVGGQVVDLRDATRAGPTVVLVTALNCSLCDYQWKWVREAVTRFGPQGLGAVIIAGDAAPDSTGLREKFAIASHSFVLLHDPSNVQAPIFGQESPRVLVLDSSGIIVYSERGTVPAPMTPMFIAPLESLFTSSLTPP